MINSKIDFLARKNKGSFLIKKNSIDLAQILSQSIQESDFLSLAESDILRESFYQRFDKERIDGSSFETQNEDELEGIVKKLKNENFLSEGFLFFRNSDEIGALKINFDTFREKLLELLKFDNDTIFYIDSNNKHWFYVTFEIGEKNTYELISNVKNCF